MNIKEYAKKQNISYATARNRLKSLGVSYTNYQKLADVYSNRKTIREMSAECGVSEATTRNFLTKFNLGYKKEYKKKVFPVSTKVTDIIMSYRQGMSVTDIAKQFNVSKQYVYAVFRQKKILLK